MTTTPRSCRSCRGSDLELVLDLGPQPATDAFLPADSAEEDETWQLDVWVCRGCALVQLGDVEAPPLEEPRGVESATMHAHAELTATRTIASLRLSPGQLVAEFDSPHGGSWLPHLLAGGLRSADDHDRADLVVDVHGLPHEVDLGAALAQRVERLAPAGRLVVEFHHLLPVVAEGQFDTFRHGHPLYLSLVALDAALGRHGLHALSVQSSSAYGGSLLVTAGREGAADSSVAEMRNRELAAGLGEARVLRGLDARAERTSLALRSWLDQAKGSGRRVIGYGAPSRAAVLLTRAGVDTSLLEFTADLSPGKHGRRIPGARIPIRSPAELLAARPDDVLILTWDIADEVRRQLAEVEAWGGRFVVPMPEPTVLG